MEDFIQPLVSSVRRKQRLDPVDPYPVTIYAFGLGNASIPVANLIRRVEINLPVSLQKILKNAKAEVTFPHRKLLCSHLYYFTKAERQTAEDFKRGLQVFGLRIRKLISELKTTWSTVLRMLDRCLSQQELFMESLRHDMEKYRTQTLNKDHIVSQKTYDSWVQSERDVTAKTKKASEDVNLADMRLKLLFNEVSKDLSGNELMKLQDGESTPEDKFDSLAEKSLSLVKALKFIPIEGRAERDSVKDIAQHVVKCLKTRDAYLQHLFNRKEKLISQFSQLQEASVSNTELARDLDLLSTSISKMQRRRQSDIWKLLAAAISNASTSPEPPGSHHFGARARTTSTSNPPPMMMTLNPSILAQLEISSGRTEVLSVESRRLMATAEEAVKVAMNR